MGILLIIISIVISKAQAVSLDAHVHYQSFGSLYPATYQMRAITPEDSKHHFESVLAQPNLNRFFLLSEAYLAKDLEAALTINQNILELSRQQPRAIPVCGVSTSKEFYSAVMKHCLDNGMRGFKFHLSNENQLLGGQALKDLAFALAQIPEDTQAFALIHFYFTGYDPAADQAQAQNLIALSLALPNIRFIIAHAGTGNPALLSSVADFYAQNPNVVKNIYTETSTLFTSFGSNLVNYYGYSLDYYRELLNRFGIERVLFGSDTFVNNPVNQNEINFILDKGFSLYEQDRLLEKNGEDFLFSLRL
jgi:predicted TIM-barrel fold metal-dependent hydrolase